MLARATEGRLGPRLLPAALAAFFVAMGAAWLVATPPGSAFDEPAHYVKALGVGHGQPLGRPPSLKPADLRQLYDLSARKDPELERFGRLNQTPSGRWQARTQRDFRIPAALLGRADFGCTTGQPNVTGACLRKPRARPPQPLTSTYTGTYQPYLYLPAGLAGRAAGTPQTGLRLGRAATLAVALALLSTATWLLWSPAAPVGSLLGLAAAVTPMVLFVSSVLSPSGPEIAGAVCFTAALLRLARGEGRPPAPVWIALAASGAVLVSARALGPAFMLLAVLAVAVAVGPRAVLAPLRTGGGRAVAAVGVVALAVAASVGWELAYQPRPAPSATSLRDAVGPSLAHLPDLGREVVGVFGALDTPMPALGYALWALLVLLVLAGALVVGERRERRATLVLVGAGVAVTLGMSLVYREIGPLHGRYVLPFLVVVPLWAGEVVRRATCLGRRALPPALAGGVLGLAVVVHGLAWWANARRFSVGADGDPLFFRDPQWAPPLGWWPWLALASGAAGLLLLAVGASLRAQARSPLLAAEAGARAPAV